MLNLKNLLVAGAFAISSSAIFATPLFYGDTAADFSGVPGSAASNAAGYYVWSNEAQTEWHVRWTGNDYGTTGSYKWWGNVEIGNNLQDVDVYLFEFSATEQLRAIDVDWDGDDDTVQFKANAGPHWDGFDFTIDKSDDFQVLGFNLGSTLFDFTDAEMAKDETAGKGIYIGEGFLTPDVLVQANSNYVQQFEVRVPEPASAALFALGLAGLAAARRRKA